MAINELHLTYSVVSINKVTFNTSHLSAPAEQVFNYQMCILKGDYLNYDVLPIFETKVTLTKCHSMQHFIRAPTVCQITAYSVQVEKD